MRYINRFRKIIFQGAILLFLLFIHSSLLSQIFINEFQARNVYSHIDTTFYNFNDWIELYNDNTGTIDISGYTITDDPLWIDQWTIPPGTLIPAKGYIILWADTKDIGLHTNFKLDGDTGYIALYNQSLQLLDEVIYSEQYPDISYGQTYNTNSNWLYFASPTPLDSNSTLPCLPFFCSEPVFSVFGGFYAQTFSLDISIIDSSEIRYTIDGSMPTEQSLLSNDSIGIDSTMIIRVRAFKTGKLPSNIITHTYFINEHNSTIPVVSITTNPENFWDDTIGIYVEGVNGIMAGSRGPFNYYQNWERPVNIEYFDTTNNLAFHCQAGVEIFGNASRTKDQKSFSIEFKKKYGMKYLRYPLFEDKDINKFNSLLLRNSGNDCQGTQYRDAIIQKALIGQMDIDIQAYQPVAVYLNGQYWGIQNLRERYDETYCETNHGANPDSVDILALSDVKAGSMDRYYEMIDFLDNNDMTDSLNYLHFQSLVDIQQLINYLVLQTMYRNIDWPRKNHKCWAPQTEGGKWRWMVYDLDITTGIWNQNPNTDCIDYFLVDPIPASNSLYAPYIIRKLLVNDDFKELLISSFYFHLNTTFSPERMCSILEEGRLVIEDEMVYHKARWGTNVTYWNGLITKMKDWLRIRPAYVMQHLADHFDLGGQIEMQVSSNIPEAGVFKYENRIITEDTIKGVYSTNRLTNVKAISYPGYSFKEWRINGQSIDSVINIVSGDEWTYKDDSTDPGPLWKEVNFVDTAWKVGASELGYGDGGEQTILDYGVDTNKYIAYYFRKKFIIPDSSGIEKVIARINYDDGVAAYLNGNEVFRYNLDANPTYKTPAKWRTNGANELDLQDFIIDTLLLSDTNIIAVEVHQKDSLDDDVSFDFELYALAYDSMPEEILYDNYLQVMLKGNVFIEAIYDTIDGMPPLFINEVVARNTGFPDEYGETDDWIEIYNNSDSVINLSAFYLSDNPKKPELWQLPIDTTGKITIEPKGFLILWADGDTLQGSDHLGFRLSSLGEFIGLYLNNDIMLGYVDSLSFDSLYASSVFGRFPDGDTLYQLGIATPGMENILEYNPIDTIIDSFSEIENTILIYPNPVRERLFIESNSNIQRIDIMNVSGSIIDIKKAQYQNTISINVSSLPPGLYLCRITTYNNTRIIKKIIVSH